LRLPGIFRVVFHQPVGAQKNYSILFGHAKRRDDPGRANFRRRIGHPDALIELFQPAIPGHHPKPSVGAFGNGGGGFGQGNGFDVVTIQLGNERSVGMQDQNLPRKRDRHGNAGGLMQSIVVPVYAPVGSALAAARPRQRQKNHSQKENAP
jgi:hypothetical protein